MKVELIDLKKRYLDEREHLLKCFDKVLKIISLLLCQRLPESIFRYIINRLRGLKTNWKY